MAKKQPAESTPTSTRKTAKYADQTVQVGTGGEVHQTSVKPNAVVTTQQGIPVARVS